MYTFVVLLLNFPSFFSFLWISLDIDVVSKLTVRYVYTQFRLLERGFKPNVRLIPGDTCFLVCCTDLMKMQMKLLIDHLRTCMIGGRRGQVHVGRR